MCRLVGYKGPDIALEDIIIAPDHSLLEQSQNANEAKLSVNGDGFGISWYGVGDTPGLYRDVLPAWSDGNLPSICRMIHSSLFMAHVRASTTGETSRMNCHPFTYENWSFMHNGQIGSFKSIRRRLESLLPDHLYDIRRGSTDSELLFLLLISNGLTQSPKQAIEETLTLLKDHAQHSSEPNRLTCVFSDGANLYAFRTSCDQRSPTLYLSTKYNSRTALVASEPLDDDGSSWKAFPNNTFATFTASEQNFTPLS